LIDFSIPPTFVDTARKILKEVPFGFVPLAVQLRSVRSTRIQVKRRPERLRDAERIFTGALKKEIWNRFATTILTGVTGSPNRRRAEPGKVSRDLSTTFPQRLETPGGSGAAFR
jgi:hypothetical protein